MPKTEKKFDVVTFIMDYEDGILDETSVVAGFQRLIDNRLVFALQGSYARTAQRLIDAGLCTAKK